MEAFFAHLASCRKCARLHRAALRAVVLQARDWFDTISTAEAARRLGISRRRVLALVAAKRLPAWRMGRDWRIEPRDLARVRVRRPGRPRVTIKARRGLRS
jgi:excisionase family DNA binding protein